MNKLPLQNYNLPLTLLGGQAFNWDLIDDTYYGFTQNNIIKLKQDKDNIYWQTYPQTDNISYIQKYLNSQENYPQILESITKDRYIKEAIKKYPGIRILNQDYEQTLLSFILSSNKSIKGIRKAVRNLIERYGRKIKLDNYNFYLFPKSEDLIELSEEQLRNLGFGFRARYFKTALKRLINDKDLNLELKSEEETRNYLTSFQGIGEKIADCIMAFSLEFKNVTALDVWGKRVLTEFYNIDPKLKYSEMRNWYQNYFGDNTALAGQYLFEYIRNNYKA